MVFNSQSLFHYTDTLDKLFQILEGGFYPSYCKEEIITNGAIHSYAVPIISFCDIPLSQVTEHIGKYGSFAVGVSKDFATLHGFNPVFYLENLSVPNEGIFKIHRYVLSNYASLYGEEGFNDLNIGLLSVLQAIKNHRGILKRDDVNRGDYEFYKEREWRCTPLLPETYQQMYRQDEYDQLQKDYPTKPHIKDSRVNLPLSFSDVKYIMVENDADIPKLIAQLKKFKHLYSNQDEFDILLTRIITCQQIEDDF